MKPYAKLEDYQRREIFLINYLESQINKTQLIADRFNSLEHYAKCNAYKDILYKLTKDSSATNSK